MSWADFELLIILLTISVVLILILQKFRLPSALAYLAVGILFGPSGFSWLSHTEDMNLLAELGVVFLLFTIGLEISFRQLWNMRHHILVLGSCQVILCVLVPMSLAYLLGMSLASAFVASSALSLSSTAIVVKQLKEQGELFQPHGRLTFSLLIFQDIAAIPFLVIIPMLGSFSKGSIAPMLSFALLKGIGAVLLLVFIAKQVLTPLFKIIHASESKELFLLFVLLIVTGSGWITHSLGLSMPFGAFLAGTILSETNFRHQLETDIAPFRDTLLGLFFISIGIRLESAIFLQHWYWVVWLTGCILIFKTVLITLVIRLAAQKSLRTSLRTGLILAHGGEFGFALLALAMSANIMETDYGQVVLLGVVLSMILATLIIRHSEKLVSFLPKKLAQEKDQSSM